MYFNFFPGKAQTAAVKRDAEIGVAQANRDAGIREAECEKAAMDVKYNTGMITKKLFPFLFITKFSYCGGAFWQFIHYLNEKLGFIIIIDYQNFEVLMS